jgi:hypothetical protein
MIMPIHLMLANESLAAGGCICQWQGHSLFYNAAAVDVAAAAAADVWLLQEVAAQDMEQWQG